MEINKVLIFGFIITAFTVEAKCPKSSKGNKMVLRPVGKNKGGPSSVVIAEEDNENPGGKCSYEFLPDRFKWLKPSKTRSSSNSLGKRWFAMKADEEPPPPGAFVYEEADDDADENNENSRGSRRPSPKGRKWFVGPLHEDMKVPNGAHIYEEGDTDENHNLNGDFGWPDRRKKLKWPRKPKWPKKSNINWESEPSSETDDDGGSRHGSEEDGFPGTGSGKNLGRKYKKPKQTDDDGGSGHGSEEDGFPGTGSGKNLGRKYKKPKQTDDDGGSRHGSEEDGFPGTGCGNNLRRDKKKPKRERKSM